MHDKTVSLRDLDRYWRLCYWHVSADINIPETHELIGNYSDKTNYEFMNCVEYRFDIDQQNRDNFRLHFARVGRRIFLELNSQKPEEQTKIIFNPKIVFMGLSLVVSLTIGYFCWFVTTFN